MTLRDTLNSNPVAVAAVAVILVGAALAVLLWPSGGPAGDPNRAYYLDLDTDELFTGHVDDLLALETPSGGDNGVRAAIYACGSCPRGIGTMTHEELEQTNAFIAYLERYSDEARSTIQAQREHNEAEISPDLEAAMETGLYLRRPDGHTWHQRHSTAGMQLAEAALVDACVNTGERLRTCRP